MGGKVLQYLKSIPAALRRFFSNVKTWQLCLILIPLLFITATLLRFDNLKMVELRDAVIAADEIGDDTAIIDSLQQLKTFTESHTIVNFEEENGLQRLFFGSGPVWLEGSYNRKAEEEIAKAQAKLNQLASKNNPNGAVFSNAMAVCEPQAAVRGWSWYLNCMTTEINKYPSATSLITTYTANIPSTALYRYDFVSPIWTPTFSGFMIILCLILIIWIVIRVISWLVIRIALIFIK